MLLGQVCEPPCSQAAFQQFSQIVYETEINVLCWVLQLIDFVALRMRRD